MQTRWQSLLEVTSSTTLGFLVALATQLVVFPLFNLETTFVQDLKIAFIFTAVSILRSYLVRRLFNYLHSRETRSGKNS